MGPSKETKKLQTKFNIKEKMRDNYKLVFSKIDPIFFSQTFAWEITANIQQDDMITNITTRSDAVHFNKKRKLIGLLKFEKMAPKKDKII